VEAQSVNSQSRSAGRQLSEWEELARSAVAQTLGLRVEPHDDNSRPSMYDLKILDASGFVTGAVEVFQAAEQGVKKVAADLRKQGGRWIYPDLEGGWLVDIDPRARVDQLWREVPLLLRSLESTGVTTLYVDDIGSQDPQRALMRRLGVHKAHRLERATYGGIVYPQPYQARFGFAPDHGDAVAEWVGPRIAARPQVAKKLNASGCASRHAFVWVSPLETDAPFVVLDALLFEPRLPRISPVLQPGITDVWVSAQGRSGVGVRWSATTGGWERFRL
jgi:hypothetical protein